MLPSGLEHDYISYLFVVKALAQLPNFKICLRVHYSIMKTRFFYYSFVGNSLKHMYDSCGKVLCTWKGFDELISKNRVSWNCMLLMSWGIFVWGIH